MVDQNTDLTFAVFKQNPRACLASLSLCLLGLGGCATSGGVKLPVPDESHLYVDGLQAQPTQALTNELCVKYSGQPLEADWRKVADIASSCARSENWVEVQRLGEALAVREPHAPWGPYYLSLVSESRGQFPKALWMSDLALRKAPQVGMLHLQKARIHWRMGETSEAIRLCEKALELDSKLSEAARMLAFAEHREREFQSSWKHWGMVLAVQPQDREGLLYRSEAALALGKTGEAIEDLEKLATLDKDRREPKMRLAKLFEEQRKDLEAALKLYREALANKRATDVPTLAIEAKIKSLEKKVQKPAERALATDSVKPQGAKQ